ncbi:MAG: hypothetical protein AB7F35_04200 [Acetobacteraceae bacterium]
MTAPSANPVSTISPAEIQILVARAGLVLNPGQLADLVLAWRQVAGLIAEMQRDRPLADDMALVFRLPPPAPCDDPAPPAGPGRRDRSEASAAGAAKRATAGKRAPVRR